MLSVLLFAFLLGQAQHVLYGLEGVDFFSSEPNFTYSGKFASLRGIEFKNFTIHTFDEKGRHLVCGKLTGGVWQSRGGWDYDSLKLRNVLLLPSSDPSSE